MGGSPNYISNTRYVYSPYKYIKLLMNADTSEFEILSLKMWGSKKLGITYESDAMTRFSAFGLHDG